MATHGNRLPPQADGSEHAVMSSLHSDRLLPVDPGPRAPARRCHETVRDLPIRSPHRLDRDETFEAAAKPVSVNPRKVFEL
jgi:hypothetical protein